MNTNTNVRRFTELDAAKYRNRRVTTTKGYNGIVTEAHPSGDGTRIVLHVWNGSFSLTVDNETATLDK